MGKLTETPRTNKYEASIGMDGGFDSNFARGLERELNEANLLLKELKEVLIDMERIVNDSMLPDGDLVNISVVNWADDWVKKLKK